MTTKQKIIWIELVVVTIWVTILFFAVTIYKTEVYFLDDNPYYEATQTVLLVLAFIYAHFFLTKKFLLNIILTLIVFFIAWIISVGSISYLMSYLMKIDKITPLGWTFKYRWLDLLMINVLLLVFFEFVRIILPAQWRRS